MFLLLLSLPLAAAYAFVGNETDQQALLAFKEKISDPLGSLSSWNSSIHFCQWKGVECGRKHQRVTGISLRGLKLTGPISPYIGNLSFLRYIDIMNNTFVGLIPPEVGRLRRLGWLLLTNNSIEGEIPANISSCSNLFGLLLYGNKLAGTLPSGLGYLSRLKYFIISSNSVTGPIPSSLGNLSSLVQFTAVENELTGVIPDEFGQLKQLEMLGVLWNSLTGTIPPTIFNLTSLSSFEVGYNKLHGSLPSDLGVTLPNLEYFGIEQNQWFTGALPVSLTNASHLVVLGVGGNKLIGDVPNLGKLNKLIWLNMAENQLGTGEAKDLNFLSSLTNATNLRALVIGNNNFGGVLPDFFNNLSTSLQEINLAGNHITGSIPPEIGYFINLELFGAYSCELTGNIPHEIGKLRKLRLLALHSNRFSGSVPSALGNLSLLSNLVLSDNNLNGHLPVSLTTCRNLLELYLSYNGLTGPIPFEVGSLTSLLTFDVSENNLIGELPPTLGSCPGLQVLGVGSNSLQGIIPSTFASLQGLQELDLSHNNFSGRIPKFLEGFGLQSLNLSFNNFDDALPEGGVFRNASAVSVIGNPALCGGIPELQLPHCDFAKPTKISSRASIKVAISIISGLLGLSVIVIFLLLLRRKQSKKSPSSDTGGINQLLSISYHGLLRATEGFSANNLIGTGSYGTVYKGTIEVHDAEKIVAVKVLNLSRHGASKSFVVECEALRNIRHRNLVKVLTACSGVDYRGNEFKALVYEFMHGGSLEGWLHPTPGGEDSVGAETKRLGLLQRVSIAIDVASAVDYLHNYCQPPVLHCDLKPSNVLLDAELVGHVGDFGLARVLGGDTLSANLSSSSIVKGTVGYTAPEYGTGSEPSTSGDVYSFGILVLEMFVGKMPTHDMFKNGLDIHTFVENALSHRDLLVEAVDPALREDEEVTSTNLKRECLISIFRVGLACSSYLASQRTSMCAVVSELSSIRRRLLGGQSRS